MHLRGGVLGVYVSLVERTLTSPVPYVRSHAVSGESLRPTCRSASVNIRTRHVHGGRFSFGAAAAVDF